MIETLLLFSIMAAPLNAEEHLEGHQEWQQGRIERLTQPTGWLSLIGLHFLPEGESRIGSAADNEVRLSAGPEYFGTLRVAGLEVHFEPAEGVLVNGAAAASGPLAIDRSGRPDLVEGGTVSFLVIERGGRLALRVRDSESPVRIGFRGIESYPVQLDWRLRARYEPHQPARRLEMLTVAGTEQLMTNPGVLVFERDGREYRLQALAEPEESQLFLIFADRTSGPETYGMGRYLYTDRPDAEGVVWLDFNRAYNPPCAFTAFATCTFPPDGNRLDLWLRAGERKYALDDD